MSPRARVWLTRSAAAVVIAAAASSAAAAVAPAQLITGRSVGGASLGLDRAGYAARFGRPLFVTRYAGGMTRLTFRAGAVHVYLAPSTHRGVALLTADRDYLTVGGVGPCSPLSRLRSAYGRSLRPIRLAHSRRVAAYRRGRLVFVVTTNRVGLVMLASRRVSVHLAVNAGQCGTGEESE